MIDSETYTRDQIEIYTLHSIALAGEVYINNYGGHWKMIIDDDGTWQPYIESRGNNIDLFVWVFDSFTNRDSFYPSVHSGYLAKTNTLFKE